MDKKSLKYKIWPRVFKCGDNVTVNIKGEFLVQDADYYVVVRGLDDWDEQKTDFLDLRGFEDRPVKCRMKDGCLSFDYIFATEQEYRVRLYCDKDALEAHPLYKHYQSAWRGKINQMVSGFTFALYALDDDMWGRLPLRGDLHIHSSRSDGEEPPEVVAANYRGAGFDFVALTDHHLMQPSLDAIEAYKGVESNFKIFPGEEVHNDYMGYFHIVGVGGGYSVNEILLNEKERVCAEVEKTEKELCDVPANINKSELAWRKWIYDEIKKSGGIAIFPHPYWNVGMVNHTQTKMCMEIFRRGYCDAFEAVGGCDDVQNNMQLALYNEARAQGIKLPVVGSSDSHSSTVGGDWFFDKMWTIAFADTAEDATAAILDFKSVAVIRGEKGDINISGPLRMVQYAWFLTENYFPKHKALCYESGRAMAEYAGGKKEAGADIERAERIIKNYTDEFFGRK